MQKSQEVGVRSLGPEDPLEGSSPVFLMMYSASKLNKQGDNIQP